MGAPIKRVSEWRKLPVSLTELSIDTTLRCGQSFRWRKINDEWFVFFTSGHHTTFSQNTGYAHCTGGSLL